ncbi:MAG: hypothetical protein ACI9EF_000583 [Pseudohongiellaceae bacterium]|jgi:hypothetical protein
MLVLPPPDASSMPRSSLLSVLLVGSGLLLTSCATSADHREAIEATSRAWFREVLPDDQEDLLEQIRDLGESGRESSDWMVSVVLLARVAFENPSGLVRAEALEAAWEIVGDLPAGPIPTDGIPIDEFQESIFRFKELDGSSDVPEREELLAIAGFLASYRFPPSPDPRLRLLPVVLSTLVGTRATWEMDEELRLTFEAGAAGSVRHALSLITLYAADDVTPAAREAALAAARYLDPPAALNLITGALTLEDHAQVLLAAIHSLDALSEQVTRRNVLTTLSQIQQGSDLALRQAADALASKVGQ